MNIHLIIHWNSGKFDFGALGLYIQVLVSEQTNFIIFHICVPAQVNRASISTSF
jgi:hypothetical protein